MFLLHYTCSVLRSRNSRKAFEFLSKCLALLLYGNQYRNLCFVHKPTYLWSMSSPGGGELSLFACPGVGNRPPSKNKIANPRGYARGGMVTSRIDHALFKQNEDISSCLGDEIPKNFWSHLAGLARGFSDRHFERG